MLSHKLRLGHVCGVEARKACEVIKTTTNNNSISLLPVGEIIKGKKNPGMKPITYWVEWIKNEYGNRENSEFENNLNRQ